MAENLRPIQEDAWAPSRAEFATGGGSRASICRARLQLLKEGCLEGGAQKRRRTLRRVFYKLFKPWFKIYYRYEAKQKASAIDWRNVYFGEERGLVSVVLPVYNQAGFLEASINSVLGQTYDNFELIVVNDGSTDGVERVLEKYVTHPKVIVLTEENQKLPAALNAGFAHAKGEFLTWTSADNIMLANQLEEQVRFLSQNPFIQMVYCNYELVDEDGKPFGHWTGHKGGVINTDQDVRSLNYTYNFVNACFMYRGYVARIIGNYHPRVYGAEDYDYWMRINDHFVIQHIGQKEPYYKYRVHDNTILRREGESAIDRTIEEAQRLDLRRQRFFQLPMTFYVPQGVLVKSRKAGCPDGDPELRIVKFETCETLDTLLTATHGRMKRVLCLTSDQLGEGRYHFLLERCQGERSLLTFGIVTNEVGADQRVALELLDWVIVDTEELYQSLEGSLKDKLLCVPEWNACIDLYAIIADHHLFYRGIGSKAFSPVPNHRVFGDEAGRIQ